MTEDSLSQTMAKCGALCDTEQGPHDTTRISQHAQIVQSPAAYVCSTVVRVVCERFGGDGSPSKTCL